MMTTMVWVTISVGIFSVSGVFVAAFISKRPTNGNGKVFDLLKNDLRAILQKLSEGMVTNNTEITANNTKIETMDRAVTAQLVTQTKSIDQVHERIDAHLNK